MQRHGVLHRKRRHVLLFIFVCICAVALLWNRGEVAPTMLHKIEQPDVFNTHSVVEAVAAEDHAKVLQRHRKPLRPVDRAVAPPAAEKQAAHKEEAVTVVQAGVSKWEVTGILRTCDCTAQVHSVVARVIPNRSLGHSCSPGCRGSPWPHHSLPVCSPLTLIYHQIHSCVAQCYGLRVTKDDVPEAGTPLPPIGAIGILYRGPHLRDVYRQWATIGVIVSTPRGSLSRRCR